jgi:hypothetical protein
LNDGGFVTILAIKNYLQNFSSVYILLFNILIQFSTFLQRYISLRELSRIIHGKHGTYLQNFLTGIDSQTGNRLNGIFLHSVLHILHDIFRIQKLRNLNQKNLKNLKNRCYYVVFNWLVSEGKVYDGHSMEKEFQIIFDIVHLLSLEKGEFFGPAQLSLILTDDRNKQLLTTKLFMTQKIISYNCIEF